jgi:prenyltransferase beta subunit
MVDIKDWKQGDIAKKLEINSADIKAFRDEFLLHGTHWAKSGATIYWTDHAFWMLKKHLATPKEESHDIEVMVISAANNPRFVYGDLNGNRIVIECRANQSQGILKKKIKVTVREKNGETYYSYKS